MIAAETAAGGPTGGLGHGRDSAASTCNFMWGVAFRAMPAKPLVSTAGGRAYDRIRDAIIRGAFTPGQRLKEDELTGLCEVSRTPVREALRRLATEGLVRVVPNAGALVSAISDDELEEVYQLRAMIEGHAAERAAGRIGPDAIGRLRMLHARMEQAVTQGGPRFNAEFADANAEFHRIILDAAISPRLSVMAALVIELPTVIRTLSRYSPDDLGRSISHHRELIDALETGDGAWAASVMRSHVLAAYRALVRPVESRPNVSATAPGA